jgi:Zn-finger nucleic acid-binding protein
MADPFCPACERRLTAGSLGFATVDLCQGCGGVWFGVQALRELLGAGSGELRRLYEQVSGTDSTAPSEELVGACPHCAASLERLAVPEFADSLVLACIPCRGFWFTRTSLARLIPRDEGPNDPITSV